MHTITIKPGQQEWVAVHTDPTIMELFGTDTLPTPFLLSTPREVVQVELMQLNPDCWVK